MQEDIGARALVNLLKDFAKRKDLQRGSRIHAYVVMIGLVETDVFVGSTLVSLYAKCGSLADSQRVLDKLSIRNVVAWSALMAGYVDHGRGGEALKCFDRMQLEGVCPDAVTLVYVLKACAVVGAIDRGQLIYDKVVQEGLLGKNCFVGSALVNMYAKCGSLAKAHEVLDSLPYRDVVSWNALIAGYAQHGHGKDALNCFGQMQSEGIFPNAVTIVCILNACGSVGDAEKASKVHAESIQGTMMERNILVGNALVDVYAKCGLLVKAQEVFDKIAIRDVVSWSSLIGGYAQHGHGEKALNCFELMRLEGITPNRVTYLCVLKVCAIAGSAEKGQEIHADIVRGGLLEKDNAVGNALVDMYAKCGLLARAQEVLDNLPAQNLAAWNALISGYAQHGQGEGALNCFEQLQLKGIPPNIATYVCILSACGSIGAAGKGQELHAEIVKEGLLEKDISVGNALVDMYVKCGLLAKAQVAFDELLVRDVVSWSIVIAGYAQHGDGKKALTCFEHMKLEGVSVDAVILAGVLKACGDVGAADKGQEVHSEIVRKGFLEKDFVIGTALVGMYAKCGMLAKARELFDKLLLQDTSSWSAIITGYAQQGYYEEVLDFYEQMRLDGISPDSLICVSILKACGSMGAADKGLQIHAEIVREGLLEKYVFVGNVLVDMYAKCGLLANAQEVFDGLPARNTVSWNSLIAGYARYGYGEEALKCFQRMQFESASPNVVTFLCILKACGSIGSIDKGQVLHAEIDRQGLLKNDCVVGTALVDMYAKCGWPVKAQELFDNLLMRDVVSWTALIAGYVQYGDFEKALSCYGQMQSEGISPNVITYVSILKACGSKGAADKGQELHNEMIRGGLLENESVVGNALVDMYVKCGMLDKAQEVFAHLPAQNVVAWNALITGFIAHGHSEEALTYFEQMQQEGTSPNNVSYICVLKACGSLGAASKGEEIRTLIERRGLMHKDNLVVNALVDMYAKCGLFAKAQEVFDKLLVRDIVSWSSLIAGYALVGKAELVFNLFDKMVGEGIKPDLVTLTSVLSACSHAGLLDKGHMCFEIIRAGYGIIPTLEHHGCMVDLLGRAGLLDTALAMIMEMPVSASLAMWHTMLSACQQQGNMKLARLAFEHAVELEEKDSAAYVCMCNIYSDVGWREGADKVFSFISEK